MVQVLFLRPCEDACGRGLSIGNRGKYDMGNEVKYKKSCTDNLFSNHNFLGINSCIKKCKFTVYF